MSVVCRYCFDDNVPWSMISPCHCSGTISNVHLYCIVKWLWISKTIHCPVCKMDFKNKDAWLLLTQLSTVCHLLLEFVSIPYNILFS